MLLWTGFYYIASRLSHHNKGYARLSFSGTVAPTIPTKVSNFLENKMWFFWSRAGNPRSHSVRRLVGLSVSLSVSLSLKTRSTRLMAIGLVSISDTDSLYISYQRPLMALEQVERSLLEKQEEISYSNSLTAQLLSSAYIKSLGEL